MHLKWKWKNVDIICYKLMPLVICKEIQKIKKLMKIDENSSYW